MTAWPDRVLHSPVTGAALRRETHALVAAGERWPVIDDIAFLRADRRALADQTLAALDAGDAADATALLLGDQDGFAPIPPPPIEVRAALVRDRDAVSFREAMARLAFGPVADYFAHRWSDPTYLSGLALAEAHWPEPGTVFELACGAGHFLRAFAGHAPCVAGADLVFAKLWLARHFVAPDAMLVCMDAGARWPLADGWADLVFCHDALYFLPDKPHVAREMRRVGRASLVGHAHNADVENHSAGRPLRTAEYAALLGADRGYDDHELTRAWIEERAPRLRALDDLADAPAVSFAPKLSARAAGKWLPPDGARVMRNPLYSDGRIVWPSERYAAEYGALATYPPTSDAAAHAVSGTVDPALIRSRVFVDLPARW